MIRDFAKALVLLFALLLLLAEVQRRDDAEVEHFEHQRRATNN